MDKHRPQCDGTTFTGIQAQCYKNKKRAEKKVPVYQNVTKVLDYANPADPKGIAPYARPFQDCVGGAVHAWAVDNTCGDGINGEKFCQPWPTASAFVCSGDGVVRVDSGPNYHNCFKPTNTTADLSVCHKGPAFKSLQYKKCHHGVFGPLSEVWRPWDSISIYLLIDSDLGYNVAAVSDCPIINPVYTPDETRYLKLSGIATIDQTADSLGDPPYTAASTMTSTVGRYNGLQSVSGCSDSHTGATDESGITRGMIGDININRSTIQNAFLTAIQAKLGFQVLGSGFDLTFYDVGHSRNDSRYVLSGNTYTAYAYGVPDGFDETTWAIVSTETMTVTETTVYHQIVMEKSGGFHTQTFNGTYSIPYTGAEVYADIVALNKKSDTELWWNFSDDIQMPPRQDDFVTVAPMMCYNEYPNGAAPNLTLPCTMDDLSQLPDPDTGLYPQIPWVDSGTPFYDGSILGKPLPFYCPEGAIDFQHRNWAVCFDESAGTRGWYIRSYGAHAGHNDGGDPTDAVVPLGSTLWTENFLSIALPEGGSWQYFDGGTLYVQEWLEIPAMRPSQNFAEPAGYDSRYTVEETSDAGASLVACVSGALSGNTVNLSAAATGSFSSGDLVRVWGVSDAINGICSVTRNSPTNVSLTNVVTGSQTPDDQRDFGTGMIGKVRFKSAPAILGEAKVTKVSAGYSPLTCSLAVNTALHDGDVAIVDKFPGLASGQYPIKFIAANQVALVGTTFNSHILPGGVLTSPFAAPEYWNDNRPHGDYTVTEFIQSNRDHLEVTRFNNSITSCLTNSSCSCPSALPELRTNQTNWGLSQAVQTMIHTQACLPFKDCDYQAICIALHSQDFKNGTTYGFTRVALDGVYGSIWNMVTRPQWTNALWQTPSKPCPCNGPTHAFFVSDDGSGQLDLLPNGCDVLEAGDTRVYRFPPQVESLQTLPSGAPPLPDGCYIGFLTQAQINIATKPKGNIVNPPIAPGRENVSDTANYPKIHLQNWSLWVNQHGTVCESGRFHTFYEKDDVVC